MDREARTVRRWGASGLLLPLGGTHDGAWITERAACSALRAGALRVPGVRLDEVRITPAAPAESYEPTVPPPPGALPPGPLRLSAECAVVAQPTAPDTLPVPMAAARLRAVLARTAAEGLGLMVTDVDLRVTDVLDEEPSRVPGRGPTPAMGPDPPFEADESAVAEAARSVPGVVRLMAAPGAHGRTVRIEERQGDRSLPRRHVRVRLAVAADRRAIDVARAVRGAVAEALLDRPSVAVVVTAVES
ncbi:hypothetical protein GCM10022206_44240 [Streptomyces chiangmaiensis]